jgi:transposase InsO family protein
MPWEEVSIMSSKKEFIHLALQSDISFSELCSRFKISRPTGYELLRRYEQSGDNGLIEKSRRPHSSPTKTPKEIEDIVVELRQKKPTWGGRTIRSHLLKKGIENIPLPSTITSILKRHGLIKPSNSTSMSSPHFFERESPNELWQVDFKGHVPMQKGRCHPLTILDDHSRYCIGLKACDNERGDTVKAHFIQLFREFGLPWQMNFDNGAPWGSAHQRVYRYTEFTTWLIRLGIRVSFSRPHHPQTNGKIERFHRTLKTELLQFYTFCGLQEAQIKFNQWRDEYNMERPHHALNMNTPCSRYQPSHRHFTEQLPEIEYPETDFIATVNAAGTFSFQKKKIFISESLKGQNIAIRLMKEDLYHVYFCNQKIFNLDMAQL